MSWGAADQREELEAAVWRALPVPADRRAHAVIAASVRVILSAADAYAEAAAAELAAARLRLAAATLETYRRKR